MKRILVRCTEIAKIKSKTERKIERMEGSDMEAMDDALKSKIVVRCAKAAFLLSALKSSPNRYVNSTTDDQHEVTKSRLSLSLSLSLSIYIYIICENFLSILLFWNLPQEVELMRREIRELKMELARERLKNRRIKLCGLMEVVLEVTVVLCVSTFFLML
jgi:hypothetical protein